MPRKGYTRTQIEQKALELRKYIKKTGKVPGIRDLTKLGLPSQHTFAKHYGSYTKLIKSLGFEPNTKYYTRKELIEIFQRYKEKTGKTPVCNIFMKTPSLPSPHTYKKHFNSWENALIEAGMNPNTIHYEYDNLIIAFRNDKEGILSKESITNYTSHISDILYFLKSKDKDWKDLDVGIIAEYFTYLKNHGSFFKCNKYTKPNSASALRTKARSISTFLSWLEKWCKRKEIDPIINPAVIEEIKVTLKRSNIIPPEVETEPRALTKHEIERIRKVIDNPIDRNIFDLGLNLGLRASEYKKIILDMVLGPDDGMRSLLNGSEPIPRFESEHYIEVKGKRNKIRQVVLTEEMKSLIKKQLLLRKLHKVQHNGLFFSIGKITNLKLHPWKVNELYGKLREKSGVKFTAHNLRHSMAELFQELGITQNIVAQRLGHKGSGTQRYSRAKIEKRYKLFQEKIGVV